MKSVLIVEDDPMVAVINEQFCTRVMPDIRVLKSQAISDAMTILNNESIDLMLLDIFMPNGTGLELLEELQGVEAPPTILITAANDEVSVRKSLEYGVIDYLIKPFTFERFEQAIKKAEVFNHLTTKETPVTQDLLDSYFTNGSKVKATESKVTDLELPKGLSRLTFNHIAEEILSNTDLFSTKELSERVKISRITTKKYINFLNEEGYLEDEISYLEQGRPLTRFKLKASKARELSEFIK